MNRRLLVWLLLMVVFLAACGNRTDPLAEPADRAYTPWDKHYLLMNNIEFSYDATGQNERLSYPQITGLLDKAVEQKINEILQEQTERFGKDSSYWNEFASYNNVFYIRIIGYNENHPETVDFLFDLNTGNRLGLQDIFRDSENYIETISTAIKEEIIRLNLDGEILYRPFDRIAEDQPFMITDNALIIDFPERNPYFTGNLPFFEFTLHPVSFTIPFSRFNDEVVIYSKFLTDQPIYESTEIKKHLLPGPVTVKHKWIQNYGQGYEIVGSYPELQGMPHTELQERLNQQFSDQAAAVLNDTEFIRVAEQKNTENSDWYGFRVMNISVTANFASLISISEYTHVYRSWENRPPDRYKTYVYNTETGQQLTLGDLFKQGIDYLPLLNKLILNSPDYKARVVQLKEPFPGITADTPFSLLQGNFQFYPFKQENLQHDSVTIPYHTLGEDVLIFY